jgi:hypothetical protein
MEEDIGWKTSLRIGPAPHNVSKEHVGGSAPRQWIIELGRRMVQPGGHRPAAFLFPSDEFSDDQTICRQGVGQVPDHGLKKICP